MNRLKSVLVRKRKFAIWNGLVRYFSVLIIIAVRRIIMRQRLDVFCGGLCQPYSMSDHMQEKGDLRSSQKIDLCHSGDAAKIVWDGIDPCFVILWS